MCLMSVTARILFVFVCSRVAQVRACSGGSRDEGMK